jgi:hypothetical protein
MYISSCDCNAIRGEMLETDKLTFVQVVIIGGPSETSGRHGNE